MHCAPMRKKNCVVILWKDDTHKLIYNLSSVNVKKCDYPRFAHKLRTAGRLLEFVCIPGAKHGSGMMPQFR